MNQHVVNVVNQSQGGGVFVHFHQIHCDTATLNNFPDANATSHCSNDEIGLEVFVKLNEEANETNYSNYCHLPLSTIPTCGNVEKSANENVPLCERRRGQSKEAQEQRRWTCFFSLEDMLNR
jgi:hypothetical protein